MTIASSRTLYAAPTYKSSNCAGFTCMAAELQQETQHTQHTGNFWYLDSSKAKPANPMATGTSILVIL